MDKGDKDWISNISGNRQVRTLSAKTKVGDVGAAISHTEVIGMNLWGLHQIGDGGAKAISHNLGRSW